MPQPKSKVYNKNNKFKKNYKHGNRNDKNKNKKHTKKDDADYGKIKKFKYLQRNKETEEAIKRQRALQEEFQQKYNKVDENDEESEEESVDPFQALLSSFTTAKSSSNKAIESSSDEEEEDSNNNSDVELNNESDDEIDSIDKDIPKKKFKPNNDGEIESGSENDESDDEQESENKDETDDEQESEIESTEDVDNTIEPDFDLPSNDPFSIHLDHDLSPELLNSVTSVPVECTQSVIKWSELGSLTVDIPIGQIKAKSNVKKKALIALDDEEIFASEGKPPAKLDSKTLEDLKSVNIKVQIEKNVATANSKYLSKSQDNKLLTPLQAELFSIMNNYQDLYYTSRSLSNGEEIRFAYCLHALNHVLKTRIKILHHNTRMAKANEGKKDVIVPDHCRDQGLTRPKVLIILPFRDSAYRVVNSLIKLLVPEMGGGVMNHKRFEEEFTGETLIFSEKHPKPEDYEKTFCGNTDDSFRIGISLTKKTIKLYSDFYSSDILISSPLGLRMIIGAVGEKDRDYDFLSSIELLILDQTEIFFAQNWDHILHTFDHLHLQPQSARNTDFSRVRSWSLNGWAKYYRQTILLASHELPEFRSLFNHRCNNYRGKVRASNPIVTGTVRNIIVQTPQVFHRIEVPSLESSFDVRFNHFVTTILPQYKNPSMAHCMVYVPSYFDYVRLRNYFKKETVNFVQICEYTKEEKVTRARDKFFHSSAHFLLYSERVHFFKRMRIKGIRHLIFYQPPNWPNFYSEMVNFMQDANQNKRDGCSKDSMTVTVLYTKYDAIQIAEIVGSEKASKMVSSEKSTHMFIATG